jgi:hypothetical protein
MHFCAHVPLALFMHPLALVTVPHRRRPVPDGWVFLCLKCPFTPTRHWHPAPPERRPACEVFQVEALDPADGGSVRAPERVTKVREQRWVSPPSLFLWSLPESPYPTPSAQPWVFPNLQPLGVGHSAEELHGVSGWVGWILEGPCRPPHQW